MLILVLSPVLYFTWYFTSDRLLVEADGPEIIESALTTWQTLDTLQTVNHEHRDTAYRSLKKQGDLSDGAYVAVLDNVLAISDRQHLIEGVIDLTSFHTSFLKLNPL